MRLPIVTLAFVLTGAVAAAADSVTDVAAPLSDPLVSDSPVPGAPLAARALHDGRTRWMSTPGVVVRATGATASDVGGAHHAIAPGAGTIVVQATVRCAGSGFTGIAVGHGDLSGDFWANVAVLLFVGQDGYGVWSGGRNLIEHPDRALRGADGEDRLQLEIDTAARSVTARLDGAVVLAGAALPASVRADGLDAVGFRFNQPVVSGGPSVRDWRVELRGDATSGLVPVDVSMCFVDPGREATLRWRAAVRGPDDRVPYVISDYAGRQVAAGDATLAPDGDVAIVRAFPPGYCEIAFTRAQQTFGVVSMDAHRGPADPFFAIDAGLSWLETDPARREALVRILARSGIAMARERLGVGNVNPAPGVYDWDGGAKAFERMRATYRANALPVLEMLGGGGAHLAPSAAGLPLRLAATAAAETDIARHWHAGWGAIEVDNEPDLKAVPADQYMALVKTASRALADASSAVPVVTGVFATIPPGPYFDACAANGMLADSDAVSFHSYDDATAVEAIVARYRAWLAQSGAESMPLWHSECGWSWTCGPGRPPREQDAASAAEISAKAIESLACGVARYFPFVFVWYEEGPKNFGMMGREATPLRSMAAYVATIHALAGRRYVGDLRGVGAPVRRARVFAAADGSLVATLYTGAADASQAGALVRLPVAVARVTGADGRELARVGDAVPVPDGFGFVWLGADAAAAIEGTTEAARLAAIGRRASPRQRLASPLVLQFDATRTPSRASTRCYLVGEQAAHALPIHARVHNLGDAAVALTPELRLPGGRTMAADPVVAPPHAAAEVAWTVDAAADLDIARTSFITVSARAAGGADPSPLAIPLVMEGTLDQHLARHPRRRGLPITDLERWRENIAGGGSSRFEVDGGVWRMTTRFSGSNSGWSYPLFALPERLDPARDSGLLIRARILGAAGGVAIMVDPSTPQGVWCPDLFPADGDWHVVFVPIADFKAGPNGAGMQNARLDVGAWTTLAIGMGGGANTLEISDLLIVGDDAR